MDLDRSKVWEFIERFVEMAAGAGLIGVMAVADRAGLLEQLARGGWVSPEELAGDRFSERYVREILAALASAAVVDFREEDGRFRLPPEHAACLTDPTSPYLLAGWLDLLPAAMKAIDRLAEVTVQGGGIPVEDYDQRVVVGIDRANAPSQRILLTRRWLPAVPGLEALLRSGARVADIGCGSGAAALAMALAYPASQVVGYDVDSRAIDRAKATAAEAGLGNLGFVLAGAESLPPGFDLVTALDVIHDLPDPKGALIRIREAVSPNGVLVMMEPNVGPRLPDNFSPRGSLLYAISVLYCLPQSLTGEGPGLGTAWGPVAAETLCREAGFGSFRILEIDNAFSSLYEVRP
jgi:2-polyprenyl-3-methyl-5-hydroxy-6-metoxy-1,4-benzoquinol methylase